jgi:hypothetical protein
VTGRERILFEIGKACCEHASCWSCIVDGRIDS